jgi:hypothetical protein
MVATVCVAVLVHRHDASLTHTGCCTCARHRYRSLLLAAAATPRRMRSALGPCAQTRQLLSILGATRQLDSVLCPLQPCLEHCPPAFQGIDALDSHRPYCRTCGKRTFRPVWVHLPTPMSSDARPQDRVACSHQTDRIRLAPLRPSSSNSCRSCVLLPKTAHSLCLSFRLAPLAICPMPARLAAPVGHRLVNRHLNPLHHQPLSLPLGHDLVIRPPPVQPL